MTSVAPPGPPQDRPETERSERYLTLVEHLQELRRRLIICSVAGSVGLFLAWVAFAYYVALPPALGFLLNFQNDIAEPQIRLGSYFDFVLRLLFWTGVAFQTPLIVMFLARLRIVTARRLIGWWRFAIVGAFVVAAVVTPTPDPVTCTIVALPLIGLYFLGVALAVAVQPRGPSRAQ